MIIKVVSSWPHRSAGSRTIDEKEVSDHVSPERDTLP
jgi:hypothetical protein